VVREGGTKSLSYFGWTNDGPVPAGDWMAPDSPSPRVWARVLIRWVGAAGVVRFGVGGVWSLLVVVVFLRGRPGPRAGRGEAGGGCGGGGGGGGGGGRAARVMAAMTRGRHLGMFLAPGWRPLGKSLNEHL
jgi:hypothetical protein